MKKHLNKYRIPSARAQWWDYARNGAYFVTIITKNRRRWFGRVENGEMILSDMGHIANNCWIDIPVHFPFVKLGPHIIMPDHVHGIIIIDKQKDHAAQNSNSKNHFGPQSQNLPSIIRGFKTGVTKEARQINPEFAWLPRYHDSIIWDEEAFEKITAYILKNPSNWIDTKFNQR